jgi:alpha-galactosidase
MSGKPVSSASLELEQKWVFSLNLPFANEKTIELATSFQTSPLASSTTSFVTVKANYNDSNDSHNSLSVTPEFESLLDVSKTVESSQTSCWKFMSPEGRKLESFILLKLSYRPAWQAIPEYTKSKRRRYLSKLCCRSKNRNEEEQVWEIYTTKNIVKTERRQLNIRGIGNCQAIQIFLKPLFDRYEDNQLQGRMNPPQKYQASLSLHKRRLGQQRSDWTRFSEPADNAGTHSSNHIVLTFAIPINGENSKRDPPLLWKVSLPRFQSTDISLDHLTVFDGSVDLREQSSHAYVQGYQSWSFTGSVGKGSNQPQPALPNMFSKAFNYGGTTCDPPTTVFPMKNFRSGKIMRENFCYKSDFFACITSGRGEVLDEFGGPALVCGWLSQHSQLGIVTIDETLKRLEMHATHKAQLVDPVTTTDWAYAQLVAPQLYDEEPMLHFLHAAAAFNQARPMQMGPLSTGWCSWYHYYENISTRNLRENFSKLTKMKKKVPTNIVVVDDGYMTAWGDWDSLKPKKFTDMALVSQDITEHGMKPGLWLAPFTCDKHSKLAKKHPEWIIRNDEGRPANSSNCGKFFYGLDATNPQVREYVFNCVQRAVKDWGFNVLKIDFLYAACLEGNGKYDLSVTRAQAMHMALQTIREAAGPDVFLIGCGCPIGVGIGYVDGMRVSADTGPTWYPSFPLPWYVLHVSFVSWLKFYAPSDSHSFVIV